MTMPSKADFLHVSQTLCYNSLKLWPLKKKAFSHKLPEIQIDSTLAWKIPWMENPGGLQSMGSQRVGRNRVTSISLSFHVYHQYD